MTFTILALFVLMVFVILLLFNGNHHGSPYKLVCKDIIVTIIPKSENVTNFIVTLLRRKRRRLRIRRGTVF